MARTKASDQTKNLTELYVLRVNHKLLQQLKMAGAKKVRAGLIEIVKQINGNELTVFDDLT